jgi:16S rRNA processing protein RimM
MSVKRNVGKIKSAHGLKGEVYLLIFSSEKNWIEEVQSIYVNLDKNKDDENLNLNEMKEFKILESSFHKDGVIAKLDSITDRNQSEALKGLNFWVPGEIFETSPDEDNFYLAQIENFKVYDNNIYIGIVDGFSFNGAHDLIIVKAENGMSYSIPLVEEYIHEIKFDKKEILQTRRLLQNMY